MSHEIGRLLGARIRALRTAAGLSQVQLASLTGKSVETISNFERGKTIPSVMTLSELSGRLGVPLKDCFDFQGALNPLDATDQLVTRLQVLSPDQQQLVRGFIDMLIRNK